jgi:hypothetical protein
VLLNEFIPKGLKVHNCYGTLIYDSSWIEGVDYTTYEFNNENYESESDSDQDKDEIDNAYEKMDPEELNDLQQDKIIPPNLHKISQDEEDNIDIDEDGEEENADINKDGKEEEEASSNDEEEEALSNEDSDKDKRSVNPNTAVTRSGRISKAAEKLNLFHSAENFYQDASNYDIQDFEGVKIEEYTSQNA